MSLPRDIVVLWKDAVSGNTGWHLASEWREFVEGDEILCVSRGLLIGETDEWLTLAQTNSGDAVNGLLKIYRPMVVETIDLPDLDTLRALAKGGKKPPKRRKR